MKSEEKYIIDPICNMVIEKENSIVLKLKNTDYFFCSEGCKKKFEQKRLNRVDEKLEIYDLIIIGGGPAGLTAGVYASILKLHAFLISKELGGQAIDSTKIENYMGFDFITGPELIEKFHYQLVNSHFIDHLLSEVEIVEQADDKNFVVTIADSKKIKAKTILLATGMRRRKLNIPGESEFQRKGIFYGSIQDVSYLQDNEIAIIGGGNSALQLVEDLHEISNKIYLISDTVLTGDATIIKRIKKIKTVEIFEEYKIEKFIGDKVLSGVSIRKKGGRVSKLLPVSGVQIAIGLKPDTSLVTKLVDLNDKGEILINQDCSTSYPGIFAAGDVTNVFGKRIIIASGEGAKAVLALKKFIINNKHLKK